MSTLITILEDNTVIELSSTGPQGATGPTGATGANNVLSIGTVTGGASASATITGTSPTQTLNLVLPTGATGPQGPSGVVGVDSGELTNTGTSTSAQLGLAAAGTAGTYTKVTTDSFGRVSSGTTLSATDVPSLDPTKITGTAAVLSVANAFSVGGHVITNAVTSVIPLLIKRVINQVADLIQYQMSTGTVLGGRNTNAQIWTGGTNPALYTAGGATTAASGDGTTATLTLTSASNLAVGDWIFVAGVTPTGYNTTGALVTAVSNTSTFTVSYANTTTGLQTVAGAVYTAPQLTSIARSAGTKAAVFRAAASQTSPIAEFQDSSGNALSTISATGGFASSSGSVTAPTVGTTNNSLSLVRANSGGMVQMAKATAYSAPGATDYARIALIAGTTAGTLKLVITGGTSATPVTIVDNIPQ